jgi:3-isopropylmalate/(R)-2-methylmalate dehydratase small subunit
MEPFKTLTAIAVPLLRDNIDTDVIIPSREIKRVGKIGLAAGLFAGWRYLAAGREPNPDFVLNHAAYAGAGILIGGSNFGCGSSREHAVWALAEYGFRAILAPSFAPIFFDNCLNNGVLAARLPAENLQVIASAIAAPNANHSDNTNHSRNTTHQANVAHPLTVDLERCEVSGAGFGPLAFSIEPHARARLLEGLDAIDFTLRSAAAIQAFRSADRPRRPWAYLEGPA